jgi:hypothetical protein
MTGRSEVDLQAGAPRHRRDIHLATGLPVLDAQADFQRARRAQIAARALRWLLSRRAGQARPRSLDSISALAWTAGRRRVIPLQAIVGTVDATTDFDADFRPATNRIAARWQRVALACRRGDPLPPITVIDCPDGYYVIDGRHRVSVARALGEADIAARVSPSLQPARPEAGGRARHRLTNRPVAATGWA